MEEECTFVREDLDNYMPKMFKGMHKSYMLTKIFDDEIQKKWKPEIGDVIVGPTGNIFIISNVDHLDETLGGDLCFYGGHLCNRDGGNTLDDVTCHTMNEKGKWIGWNRRGELEVMDKLGHSKYSHFRFVPYPHETNRM